MHQPARVRRRPVVSTKHLVIAALAAVFVATPAIVYASNSNPLCYLVAKYSTEWYVLFCNYTESADGEGG